MRKEKTMKETEQIVKLKQLVASLTTKCIEQQQLINKLEDERKRLKRRVEHDEL